MTRQRVSLLAFVLVYSMYTCATHPAFGAEPSAPTKPGEYECLLETPISEPKLTFHWQAGCCFSGMCHQCFDYHGVLKLYDKGLLYLVNQHDRDLDLVKYVKLTPDEEGQLLGKARALLSLPEPALPESGPRSFSTSDHCLTIVLAGQKRNLRIPRDKTKEYRCLYELFQDLTGFYHDYLARSTEYGSIVSVKRGKVLNWEYSDEFGLAQNSKRRGRIPLESIPAKLFSVFKEADDRNAILEESGRFYTIDLITRGEYAGLSVNHLHIKPKPIPERFEFISHDRPYCYQNYQGPAYQALKEYLQTTAGARRAVSYILEKNGTRVIYEAWMNNFLIIPRSKDNPYE